MSLAFLARVLLFLFVLLWAAVPAHAVSLNENAQNCFSAEENKKLSFKVFRQGWAPAGKSESGLLPLSPLYPATAFATMQLGRISGPQTQDAVRGMSYANYYFLWGNRCLSFSGDGKDCRNIKRVKGNDYNDKVRVRVDNKDIEARPMFSSYRQADACTYLQVLHATGSPEDEVKSLAEKNGLKTFFRHVDDSRTLSALASISQEITAGRIEKRPYFIDTCLFDRRAGAGPAGIIIDYEVWDERSPEQTRAFLLQLAHAVHARGKSFMVFTNSLDSAGARKGNGIDVSNLKDIVSASDGFFPVVWSGATPGGVEIQPHERKESFIENFRAQLRYLEAAGVRSANLINKVYPVISLYDLRADEALQLHQAVKSNGMGGVMIWRNGAPADSACSVITGPILRNLLFGK